MTKVSSNPLISVVIPIYNVEEYLDKCVESVVNQTYNNLEILLVDDGSPDNSPKKCDEWAKKDKRIKVIHKKNGGLSDARNRGIKESKGEYITFIDSDDYVENNYVEFLYNLIKDNNAYISMGKQFVRYPKKVVNTGSGNFYDLDKEEMFKKLLYGDDFDVSAWAKLYKKELFKTVEFPKGRLFEDAATTYKLLDLSKKSVLKSVPIYNYIIRDTSITNSGFNKKKLDLITSTKEMTDYLKKKYPKLEKACNRRLMYSYLSTLTQYAKTGGNDKSTKDELMSYIKANRKEILKDKLIPKRDKIALYATYLGYNFFKFSWNIYEKIGR